MASQFACPVRKMLDRPATLTAVAFGDGSAASRRERSGSVASLFRMPTTVAPQPASGYLVVCALHLPTPSELDSCWSQEVRAALDRTGDRGSQRAACNHAAGSLWTSRGPHVMPSTARTPDGVTTYRGPGRRAGRRSGRELGRR